MIIETDTNNTYTTERIGAEPISIDGDAFEYQVALDDLEYACNEIIGIRANTSGESLTNALRKLHSNLATVMRLEGLIR